MALKLCDSDDELGFNFSINKNYAEKYDTWRRKEELQKFKDRFGKDALDGSDGESSSSSSADDDDATEMTETFDKEFYHTLSSLKSKDPKIYDKDTKFFENVQVATIGQGNKSETKPKPMFLRDYERKIIEDGGMLSDEDEETEESEKPKILPPSYYEEQDAIKKSFRDALHETEDDVMEGNTIGGLFSKRIKSLKELEKEEDDYAAWLLGNKEKLEDVGEEQKLSHLRSYWNDPTLDPEEVFLRDYILQKKFKVGSRKGGKGAIKEEENEDRWSDDAEPSGDLVEQEEKDIEALEEFEHKFNFRFEEPDQEFIKRYPRTLESSLRRKDDKRKQKRDEVRSRKEMEKQKVKEQLRKAKELKQKEIEERLKQLCNITGNADVGFKGGDLDEDFDPEKHDRRMSEIFSEDAFYAVEESVKPVFPSLDEELDLEEWDSWGVGEAYGGENIDQKGPNVDDSLHSEDPNFNMDCEYDPKKSFEEEMLSACHKKSKGERGKGRRWRARQSRLAKGLLKDKPQFDPMAIISKAKLCKGEAASAFEKYVDEYYGLEYEDVIGGDLPCRFKYRKVIPNDFGLTVEEILGADDKELNRWCSLKKAVQVRSEENEKYDLQAYRKKSCNINLKRKVFHSLYSSAADSIPTEDDFGKKGAKKVQCEPLVSEQGADALGVSGGEQIGDGATVDEEVGVAGKGGVGEGPLKKKKKKRKRTKDEKVAALMPVGQQRGDEKRSEEAEEGVNENWKGQSEAEGGFHSKGWEVEEINEKVDGGKREVKQSRKRKWEDHGVKREKTKAQREGSSSYLSGLTKSRLKAYGINPKRFGNKLKYKPLK